MCNDESHIVMQNDCDKKNTEAKMKTCEEYTMSYEQNSHMWRITPEVKDEMAKKKRREILSNCLQQLVENVEFGN